MPKPYNDRQMDHAAEEGELFFFPKHNPPISIRAKTRSEAEAKLAEIDNPTEV